MHHPPGLDPPRAPAETPPVWTYYRIYAGLMAALYVLTAIAGVLYLVGAGFLPTTGPTDQAILTIYGVVMLALGVGLAVAFGAAFFIPRKKWAWVYHLVLICLGLTSCCCMPVTIPLLVFWLKPEAKAMFEDG